MVKIYHRPDPPPPDVDSNRAVRKTDTFLNREASAGLFQRALVKAQGQEKAVERSTLAGSGQQQQIESDAHSVLGTKARESVLASQIEPDVGRQSIEHNAVVPNADEVAKAAESADVAELEEKSDDSIDTDSEDQVAQHDQDAVLAGSTTGLDSTAAYQLFENIQQQNNSAEPEPLSDSNTMNESINNGQDATVSAQAAVAHSATAASMESRIDTMSSMSDLIDMLETASQLPAGNEWTLILEDDGPVSELTLSSGSDGRWNIDLLTSFDNDEIDDELMGNLRRQLDTAGIAVANIALIENAKDSNTSNTA